MAHDLLKIVNHIAFSSRPEATEDQKEHFFLAIAVAFTSMILFAIILAKVTAASFHQFAWLGIGIGWGIGTLVRLVGNGDTPKFGILAGLSAFGSCYLADHLTVIFIIQNQLGISLAEFSSPAAVALLDELASEPLSLFSLIFYFLAPAIAYKVAFYASEPDLEDDPFEQLVREKEAEKKARQKALLTEE